MPPSNEPPYSLNIPASCVPIKIEGTGGLVTEGGYPVPGLVGLNATKLLVPTQILVPLTEVFALVGKLIGKGKSSGKVESSPGAPIVVG